MPWEGGAVPREPWQRPGKEAPRPENGGIVAPAGKEAFPVHGRPFPG